MHQPLKRIVHIRFTHPLVHSVAQRRSRVLVRTSLKRIQCRGVGVDALRPIRVHFLHHSFFYSLVDILEIVEISIHFWRCIDADAARAASALIFRRWRQRRLYVHEIRSLQWIGGQLLANLYARRLHRYQPVGVDKHHGHVEKRIWIAKRVDRAVHHIERRKVKTHRATPCIKAARTHHGRRDRVEEARAAKAHVVARKVLESVRELFRRGVRLADGLVLGPMRALALFRAVVCNSASRAAAVRHAAAAQHVYGLLFARVVITLHHQRALRAGGGRL